MAFNPTYAKVGDQGLDVWGATEVGLWTITFGAADTYVTGGLALTAATFGLTTPVSQPVTVLVVGQNTAGEGLFWMWNTQTGKLQAFWDPAESASPQVFAELGSASALIQNVALTVLIIVQR
jgi:hypothetical protein